MSVRYEVWLSQDDGTRIAYLDQWQSLEFTRVVNKVGAFSLIMPKEAIPDMGMFTEGHKLEILRASDLSLPLRYEMVGLITGRTKYIGPQGQHLLKVTGVDGNSILMHRRIFAQPGTTYARKTGPAGNIAKAYVRQALQAYSSSSGSGINTPGDRTHIVPYFTVAADSGEGASFTKNYEWKVLFDAVNGICDASNGRGYPVYWNVHPVSGAMYQFRTYAGQLGADLTGSVVLGPEYDNVSQAKLVYESENEVNYCIGIGEPGSKTGGTDWRWSQGAGDDARMHFSLWSYHEDLVEGTYDHGVALWDEAVEYISEHRPYGSFSCAIQELPNFRYGQHWNWGDKVSISFWGDHYTGLIRDMHIQYAEKESIRASVEILELGGAIA